MIRKAVWQDLDAIDRIYQEIHDAEEAGTMTIGWIRNVYPTRETASAALERDDIYVLEENGVILGSAIINQFQMESYQCAPWEHPVPDDQVCVLHTLVISPLENGKGYGRTFLSFYEEYARQHRLPELRLDTNARNTGARAMYRRHGYREVGTVPTVFNGIPDVQLVLLEKQIILNKQET